MSELPTITTMAAAAAAATAGDIDRFARATRLPMAAAMIMAPTIVKPAGNQPKAGRFGSVS
jgi:hypothetical protein